MMPHHKYVVILSKNFHPAVSICYQHHTNMTKAKSPEAAGYVFVKFVCSQKSGRIGIATPIQSLIMVAGQGLH